MAALSQGQGTGMLSPETLALMKQRLLAAQAAQGGAPMAVQTPGAQLGQPALAPLVQPSAGQGTPGAQGGARFDRLLQAARDRDAIFQELRDNLIVTQGVGANPTGAGLVGYHVAPNEAAQAFQSYIPQGYAPAGWDAEKLSPRAQAALAGWKVEADKKREALRQEGVAELEGKTRG